MSHDNRPTPPPQGQLARFDEATAQLQETVDQAEVGYAAGKAAFDKMPSNTEAELEKKAIVAAKLTDLRFNINLLKGLIEENNRCREAIVKLMNPDLSSTVERKGENPIDLFIEENNAHNRRTHF